VEDMVTPMFDWSFYNGKKVLVTGHTGFKGSWLCKMLTMAGAEVTGYALRPPTTPSLFEIGHMDKGIRSVIGDVRNLESMQKAFHEAQPEIVFHLAAQPIVRDGYKDPVVTYETNVMGTVHVLECVRNSGCVRSFLNVTTDKVYRNNEWCWGYRENEPLDGMDPYSNSKSCSELVTNAYRGSFFSDGHIAVSTARAGNVIGGGDFAPDRIIPDCVRAVTAGKSVGVRNPDSIRPYQHVLEPLYAYLMIAARQYEDVGKAGCYNVGPDECDCVTTRELVQMFCDEWGEPAKWESQAEANAPHEACYLKLDCSKLKAAFGWQPRWHIKQGMEMTCRFSKVWLEHGDIAAEMRWEIETYLGI